MPAVSTAGIFVCRIGACRHGIELRQYLSCNMKTEFSKTITTNGIENAFNFARVFTADSPIYFVSVLDTNSTSLYFKMVRGIR
jgi:hypothetical protein